MANRLVEVLPGAFGGPQIRVAVDSVECVQIARPYAALEQLHKGAHRPSGRSLVFKVADEGDAHRAVIPVLRVVALHAPAHALEDLAILADQKVPRNVGKVLAQLKVPLGILQVAAALLEAPAGAVAVAGVVDDDVLGAAVKGACPLARRLCVPLAAADEVAAGAAPPTGDAVVVVEVRIGVSCGFFVVWLIR